MDVSDQASRHGWTGETPVSPCGTGVSPVRFESNPKWAGSVEDREKAVEGRFAEFSRIVEPPVPVQGVNSSDLGRFERKIENSDVLPEMLDGLGFRDRRGTALNRPAEQNLSG